MRANLMFREGSCPIGPGINTALGDLISDLELGHILEHMSKGDKVIYRVCKDTLLRPLQTAEAISYRRDNLRDALKNHGAVRRLYSIAAETDNIRSINMASARLADSFANTVETLKIYTKLLHDLREVADKKISDFESEGFKSMLAMFQKELSDEYFDEVNENLHEINNVDNILISAKLGSHLQSVDYTLRRKEKGFWLRWAMATSFTADVERNPAEIDDLYKRRERAISEATNVLLWSARYLESFFVMLREELAFYAGCISLTEELQRLGMPVCMPVINPPDSTERSWHGLYDVSLVLMTGAPAVGNDFDVSGKHLFIVTGANQGGKSTFLRSIGQAQLMAQCGMPVGADSFKVPIRSGLFTHFKRDEDSFMKSGKLDEELRRMSRIVDDLKPGALILLNESFASTNEREGSEICRQLTDAFIDSGVEVFSVTHMYIYASSYLGNSGTQFLRAQRREDMERTFKILPGEPEETAYGEDLYQKIFVQTGRHIGDECEAAAHLA